MNLNPIKQRQDIRGHRWLAAAAFSLTSMLLVAAPASAQGWSAPTQLNTNDIDKPTNTGSPGSTSYYHPFGPSVSLDAAGNANVAWAAWILKQRVATPNKELWGASISAGGTLATNLMIPTVISPNNVSDAQVKTDDAGNSIAVWLQFDGTSTPQRTMMMWSSKSAGGAWSAPAQFTTSATVLLAPKFAMNSRGDALLTWLDRVNGITPVVMYSVRRAGSSWSVPAVVATLAYAGTPSLQPVQALIGENGDALISWEGHGTTCTRSACIPSAHELHVSRLASNAVAWIDSGKLATPATGYANESQILMDRTGRAGVVYRQRLGVAPAYSYNLRASVQQSSGQAWSTPVNAFVGLSGVVRAGNDDLGNVTVVTSAGVSLAGNLTNNTWSAPQVIPGLTPTNTLDYTFSLSVNRSGAAVLATRTVGVIRPAGSSQWGAVATLGNTLSTSPFIVMAAEATAINSSGKAIVVYRDWDSVALTYRLFAVTSSNTGAP